MDVLAKLQRNLHAVNQLALSKLRPGDALEINNQLSILKEWVQGASEPEQWPLESIEETLRSYKQYGFLKGLRQIRLVSYGVMQGVGADRLIEDRPLFSKLLEYVEFYKERRRTFRKLYRGLLSSFFSCDPCAPELGLSGRDNREQLRVFLQTHLESFVLGEFTPDWLAALAKYPDLLSEQPGRSVESLHGDWSVLTEIFERLELDSASWLVRQLVMAPLKAAESMDDPAFKEHLDDLLLLLTNYPLFSGEGLKVLLDRYARCVSRPVNDTLMCFSLDLWGNPWLPAHAHQWQCGIAAREMLTHWLKQDLLGGFFSLLSNDDKVHTRRMNFWDLYCEDLTGMYFALGKNAYTPGDMALYKFRRKAKGLVAKLTEEKHAVHTCIMQFARHHVVEFNRENNVAYFYDTRQGTPSFYFAKGWVDIGAISVNDIAQGVDIARVAKPLRHQDTKHLTWEGKFAHELGATDKAVRAFCLKYQCQYEDRRDQDGCQQIRPLNPERYGLEVWSVLSGWGYAYNSEDKVYCQRA